MDYMRFTELGLKREIRRSIFRIFWFHASYHSKFVSRFSEPIILNYNVFEYNLIDQARKISKYDNIMNYVSVFRNHISALEKLEFLKRIGFLDES